MAEASNNTISDLETESIKGPVFMSAPYWLYSIISNHIEKSNYELYLYWQSLGNFFHCDVYRLSNDFCIFIYKKSPQLSSAVINTTSPEEFSYGRWPDYENLSQDQYLSWCNYMVKNYHDNDHHFFYIMPVRTSQQKPEEILKSLNDKEQSFLITQTDVISIDFEKKYALKMAGSMVNKGGIVKVQGNGNSLINDSPGSEIFSSVNSNDIEVFTKLFGALEQLNDSEEKTEIDNAIREMQSSLNQPESFKSSYKSFMELVAVHMTIFGPFIPMLTNLL